MGYTKRMRVVKIPAIGEPVSQYVDFTNSEGIKYTDIDPDFKARIWNDNDDTDTYVGFVTEFCDLYVHMFMSVVNDECYSGDLELPVNSNVPCFRGDMWMLVLDEYDVIYDIYTLLTEDGIRKCIDFCRYSVSP